MGQKPSQVRRPRAVPRGGDGPSTSGGSGGGGTKGKKRGWDTDGGEDDSNKRQKTEGEKAPPKPMVARKEPRKKGCSLPSDRPKATSAIHLPH